MKMRQPQNAKLGLLRNLDLFSPSPGRSHAWGISSRHSRRRYPTLVASPGGPTLFIPARLSVWLVWGEFGGLMTDKSLSQRNFLVGGLTEADRYAAVAGCS